MTLQTKREAVLRQLRQAVPEGTLAVAFSGGVDSSLLLALALEALDPKRVLAITAHSESLAQSELEGCQRITRALGAELLVVHTHEMEREGYRENSARRCYHCKTELFERIDEEASHNPRIVAVAYGATADDLGDHRPGMEAAREHAVLAPLADADLSKPEIRLLSQELGLETWDKPAQPCLASRIPYGQQVTPQKLARVEAAEEILRGLGFRELRVRHHSQDGAPLARIEVPAEEISRLCSVAVDVDLATQLRALGFAYVTIDLEGFRSGRLNEVLQGKKLPAALPIH